jgi:hypothetical protein
MPGAVPRGRLVAIALATAGLVGVLAGVFSPFLIAPAIAAVATMALVFTPTFEDLGAMLTLAILMMIAILGPFAAERAGLLPQTLFVEPGAVIFRASGQAALGEQATYAAFILYVLALIAVAAGMAHAIRRAERTARHQLRLQTWQLSQLVPKPAT